MRQKMQNEMGAGGTDHGPPARAGVIYLKDVAGNIHGMIHAAMSAHGKWPELAATKVRHRKSGDMWEVVSVDTATRQIRLNEFDQFGEPMRTRWYPIEDFDVMGLPLSVEAAKRELQIMEDRKRELEELLLEEELEAEAQKAQPKHVPAAQRTTPYSPGEKPADLPRRPPPAEETQPASPQAKKGPKP